MKQPEETINCGLCQEGIATHCTEPALLSKDDVNYTVTRHFYKCNSCKERYTTDHLDLLTLAQIPGSIWEKELAEFNAANP